MNAKREAIDLIENLPESITINDIIAELIFKAKVERGLLDVEEGRVSSQEEVEERMRSWAKSVGQK